MMTVAEILAALLAYGILHMRDVEGYAGWRWLFLIEVRQVFRTVDVASSNGYAGPYDTYRRSSSICSDAGWSLSNSELVPRQEGMVFTTRGDYHCQPCFARRSLEELNA